METIRHNFLYQKNYLQVHHTIYKYIEINSKLQNFNLVPEAPEDELIKQKNALTAQK